MILRQYGVADRFLSWKTLLPSYEAGVTEVHEFLAFRSVSSVKQNRRGGSLRVVSEALEASPVGTKPPATIDERISMDGRHDSDAAGPLSTTTSSLQGRAGGSAFTPKLVELVVGPGSTRRVQKQFLRIACTAVAVPYVRSRVFVVSAGPSASMTRRDCRASCSRRVTCWSIFLISLEISRTPCSIDRPSYRNNSILFSCLSNLSSQSRYISPHVSWPDPSSSFWGTGPLPSGSALLAFRSTLASLDTSVLMRPTDEDDVDRIAFIS